MEAVWMSLPRRSDPGMSSCRAMCRAAACSTKNAARRFTFITRSHSSPVTSNMGWTRMTPALLKSTSSRPQRRYTSSTIRSMSSFRVTSALTATWPSSPATFSTLAPSRSASTSRAPSAVSRRAAAAPMPLAAPVMSTVRPLRLGISSPRVLACERRSVLRGRRGHLEPLEREGDRPASHESTARHLVAADGQLSDHDRALILEGEHVVGHAALDGQGGLPSRSDPRRAGIDGPSHLARSLLKLEAELSIDHWLAVRTSHEAQPHAVHVLRDHGSIDPRRLGTAEAEEERGGEEAHKRHGAEKSHPSRYLPHHLVTADLSISSWQAQRGGAGEASTRRRLRLKGRVALIWHFISSLLTVASPWNIPRASLKVNTSPATEPSKAPDDAPIKDADRPPVRKLPATRAPSCLRSNRRSSMAPMEPAQAPVTFSVTRVRSIQSFCAQPAVTASAMTRRAHAAVIF